jgi:hypothetical protein
MTDGAKGGGVDEADDDSTITEFEKGLLSTDDVDPDGATRGDGWSALAIPADKTWDAGDRPPGWQGRVYGLVVHTTGSGLPASADERGVYHTVRAVDYYSDSHGCHYVNGWAGVGGGDLVQVANEREQAHGVGVTNTKEPSKDQRRSIEAGRFEADLPPVLVRLWRRRWSDYEHSLAMLPGTKTVNSCYVHVECVPCVYWLDNKLVTGEGAEPMRAGLRFTRAQHDTVARLAIDIATRNGWPLLETWWHTPRLVGHEDLTPISRHDNGGGWDPGYLRESPYFDWDYVYQRIQEAAVASPRGDGRAGTGLADLVEDVRLRLSEMLGAGDEQRAVTVAIGEGVRDLNQLTNLVFFARHPEMNGRRIAAHETELAQEWIDIRDGIVRPVVERTDT